MDILLTNDDGPESAGLKILAERLSGGGRRLRIVCPALQQSAVGMSITLFGKIAAVPRGEIVPGVGGWLVEGTPVDCVKLALRTLYRESSSNETFGALDEIMRKETFDSEPFHPELVISGINPGANVGMNTLYSGTVAAALEANICGLPAISVSVDTPDRSTINSAENTAWLAGTIPSGQLLDTDTAASSSSGKNGLNPPLFVKDDFRFAADIVAELLKALQDSDSFDNKPLLLNCNIPYFARRRAKGYRFCRAGGSRFDDQHVFEGRDGDGRLLFRLDGMMSFEDYPDDDAASLREGWVTLSRLKPCLDAGEFPEEAGGLRLSLGL